MTAIQLPPAATTRRLTDPATRVPSGTTMRFATFVLAMAASIASVFSYLWQVAHPVQQTQAAQCLSLISGGQIGHLIQKSADGSAALHMALVLCLRPANSGMTWWAGAGIVLLALGATADYLITPWWIMHVGRPGRWRPLVPLSDERYPDHTREVRRLADSSGVEADKVAFYVNHEMSTNARAFGTRRRPRVQLDVGLIALWRGAEGNADREKFRDIVLHELGHVRNRDNRSTYVTVAAWRTFYTLIPISYLTAVILSGTTPALPDAHTTLVLCALIALVFLSVRAVLRTREFHADATAAFVQQPDKLHIFELETENTTAPDSGRLTALIHTVRAWTRFHPSMAARRDALDDPGILFRPSTSAMAAAGAAVAVAVGAVNPAVFSALLTWRFGELGLLLVTSGNTPLTVALIVFGPAALLTAIPASALVCAQAWRDHLLRKEHPDESRVPHLTAAAGFAAGFAAGSLLGFDDAVAGIWGLFESSAARDLVLLLLSALLLSIILTVLSLWASECATAWSAGTAAPRGARFTFTGAAAFGALGFAPMFFAWTASYGIPINVQWVFGPSAGQHRLIGTWPIVRLLFAHPEVLGLYDDVPGSAVALGLACLFVVVGASIQTRREPALGEQEPSRRPRHVSALAITVTGLIGGVASAGLGLGLFLWLRSAVGGHNVTAASGAGLEYLTRLLQAGTAAVAAIAAVLLTWRSDRVRLSGGVLAALVCTVTTALVAPQLLYIGYLGLHHKPVNPANNAILLGMFGHAASAWTVVAAVFAIAITGVLPWRATGVQPAAPRTPTVLVRRASAIAMVAVVLAMAELIQIAYYYFTLDF